ncbi:hypothetical protein [Pseudooceanicola nanhaiensis]|uniref:hypothetical protein n=1 Tax=Pseudooceanicola nanhaiensis TaxID=375761 RepID=UPI001CD1AD78|nr:hypothetical protein [Pseudooceanicola nanhaiensis]MCA0922088.1 hypothetical protein [Pseudooceanicola nanhaiensis]
MKTIGYAIAALGFFALPLSAGDGNVLNFLQLSTGADGNALFIDQSEATGSLIAGDPLNITPATQAGNGNTAEVEIRGNGGTLVLNQNNALTGLSIGNQAEAVIAGVSGFGSILQLGDLNSATLSVQSPDAFNPASGAIAQIGTANTGTLSVDGAGASGELRQIGNGNTNALSVEGTGTTATYTQIGNGLSNQNGGVSVVSNGGSVSITQTSF